MSSVTEEGETPLLIKDLSKATTSEILSRTREHTCTRIHIWGFHRKSHWVNTLTYDQITIKKTWAIGVPLDTEGAQNCASVFPVQIHKRELST